MSPETGPDEIAADVERLLETVYARYGYDLRGYAPRPMRRRVAAALARSGLTTIAELERALVHDPAVFAAVLDDLTLRVSELFRDPRFVRAFKKEVLPILLTYPLLRMWHAGCAAGEEAYTSAILLGEAGLYERAQIYATDLSSEALAQARLGVYSAAGLQKFADNYAHAGGEGGIERYCTAGYGGFAMKPALARNILFMQHDLVSDHVFGEMQVVFCRNVLIYFGRDLRRRVLAKLVSSLAPGGFLCLGSSEQLGRADQGELCEVAAPGIYRHG